MPTIRKGALFAGLAVGAAVGAVYVASKKYAERTEPSLVDWAQARRVAMRLTRPAAGALDLLCMNLPGMK